MPCSCGQLWASRAFVGNSQSHCFPGRSLIASTRRQFARVPCAGTGLLAGAAHCRLRPSAPPSRRGHANPPPRVAARGQGRGLGSSRRSSGSRFELRKAIAWYRNQMHRQITPISALIVPSFAENDYGDWIEIGESAVLMYVEELDEAARSAWLRCAPWIRPITSRTARRTYLGNACECGALQGDWFLAEPGGPFFPQGSTGFDAISVQWIDSPLSGRAAASRGSWTDDLIARSPYVGWTPPARRRARRPT
jgi:hypothetical protein